MRSSLKLQGTASPFEKGGLREIFKNNANVIVPTQGVGTNLGDRHGCINQRIMR
jgi:hypothetical protein